MGPHQVYTETFFSITGVTTTISRLNQVGNTTTQEARKKDTPQPCFAIYKLRQTPCRHLYREVAASDCPNTGKTLVYDDLCTNILVSQRCAVSVPSPMLTQTLNRINFQWNLIFLFGRVFVNFDGGHLLYIGAYNTL